MERDGGPAFPAKLDYVQFSTGMTLRDWFAGMALQGIVRTSRAERPHHDSELAYKHADAMLSAREAK